MVPTFISIDNVHTFFDISYSNDNYIIDINCFKEFKSVKDALCIQNIQKGIYNNSIQMMDKILFNDFTVAKTIKVLWKENVNIFWAHDFQLFMYSINNKLAAQNIPIDSKLIRLQ